ncbi:NAD-dependent epimerase/dehydratase family protein [Methanothrix thermoacetophila]|uniref:NAD-dependent epimerase/dehydratase n=1 Tax=Methanothrix thermoacetophila (strain DSM 6194 / JCM 14653 / NBRC 101360 / PT) TaxID=349307 RepID=A0B822_METTP|nr:NAD-dependent epimerase/dehydratase family protein [Methanothrix thermoacetophila]ABK14846.1 NAD-dependent epimerase/dehydratase [Methanothrix thermoacetophila PT]
MTALVTGGAGFIGSNLVEELVRSGEDVIVLDNLQTGSLRNLEGLDVEIVTMSCNDIPRLDVNADRIFHLGIPSSSPMYRDNPFLVGEALNGFVAVMELARRCDARVVYASTSSLYNGLEPPHREDMEIKVTDYYTEARFAMERIAELYRKLFGVSSLGMRFFSVYGPKEESKGRYANMVTQFLWGMMRKETPVIYGDGSQTRDFIYVRDVVRALILAMDSDYNGVLNIGTGRAHSFNDVIHILGRRLGVEVRPRYVENPIKNYVQHTLADISKAEICLGFRAAYSLEDGINEIIQYYTTCIRR